MATFTPFMQSTQAQNIIDSYLNNPTSTQTTGAFRNPKFDLRTEQGLPADALYPDPLMNFSAPDQPVTDPCPAGYQLIDGVCQPIENFGQSVYDENIEGGEGFTDERDYYSIDAMRNLSDEDLLEYLQDGWLKGDENNMTVGGTFMPSQFSLFFGKQNKMRRDFIINELKRRGYYTGMQNDQPTFNLNPANKMQNYENLLQEETGQNFDQAVQNIVDKQNQLSQQIAQDDSYQYYTPTKPVDTTGSSIVINQDGTLNQQSYEDAIQQNIVNSLQSETSNYSPFLGGFTGGR